MYKARNTNKEDTLVVKAKLWALNALEAKALVYTGHSASRNHSVSLSIKWGFRNIS